MEAAGYDVTIQPFDFVRFTEVTPAILEQTAPLPGGPIANIVMTYSGSGDVTGAVTALPAPPADATPGCEDTDFAGVPGWQHRIDQPRRLHVRHQGDQRLQRRSRRRGHLQQHRRGPQRHPGQRLRPRHRGDGHNSGAGPAIGRDSRSGVEALHRYVERARHHIERARREGPGRTRTTWSWSERTSTRCPKGLGSTTTDPVRQRSSRSLSRWPRSSHKTPCASPGGGPRKRAWLDPTCT